jgi:putative transposase
MCPPDRGNSTQADFEGLAGGLGRSHPGAAASLRKGSLRPSPSALGLPPTLARTLPSTNTIESMLEICRDHPANARALAGRPDGAGLARRWMGEAATQFRRVNG